MINFTTASRGKTTNLKSPASTRSTSIFKLLSLLSLVVLFGSTKLVAQTTIVNYDFNSGGSYAALSPSLASNISSTPTSTEAWQTYGGVASAGAAFTTNSTAGNALGMANSSGTNTKYFQFQLGGSALSTYSSYRIYFQAQRSGTGATTATIAYSTNGSSYTNFGTTQSPGNGSFAECSFDLTSITAINAQSAVYFRVLVSGASGSGTFRMDNFQIRATASGPNISQTGALNSFISSAISVPSAEQTFTVAGTTLTNDIVVTAPTGFQVSTTSGSGFTSFVTLTQSGGTVATTTIYARFNPTALADQAGGNIACTSTGAITKNVAITGEVTNLSAGSIAFIAFQGATTDFFRIVTLEDIPANTRIWFTDKAWDGNGGTLAFTTGEGSSVWTSPNSTTNKGTVIEFAVGAGTVNLGTGAFTSGLGSAGEQLFAYQGTLTTPSFVAGYTSGTTISTGVPAASGTETWVPASLTNGTNFVALGGITFGSSYVTSAIHNRSLADMRSHIHNTSNLTTTNTSTTSQGSWPSYTFNIIADEPTTQPSFTAASSVGNNQMDLNFSGGNGTSYMVVMRQGSAVTATPTDATSYSTVSGSVNFSSATELSAGQKIVYNGVISGNSVTVTNLSAGTDYYYAIYAYNGTGTLANFYTTSAGTGNQTTTGSSNSAVSDIIIHASFTEPSNIDYAATQENSNLTVGTSVEVAKFTLRDGGATTDADANTTILNAITFTIANHANLRRLALYDGSTELSEVAISTGTATFSSLTLSAADNDSKDFSLRASFAGTVTDNIQFSFTVSSATADVAGSTFAAADAGAAASSTTGDRNKIEVTADRLAFVVQPSNVSVNVAINPSVTVSANDVNSNRDLDYVTDMTASTTGTFAGASTNTITPSAGLGTFSNLQFSVAAAARTIAVSSGSLTASGNSSTFDITASIETGDIAFVKYQSDAPDEFSIITFVDIPANQTFYFTDNQYTTASGPLATNEQTMTWTTPGTVITAGTVITFSNSSGALTTVTPSGNGTGTNALNGISASGDQIFMYKGTSGSPTQYICGLNFGNSGAWQTSAGLSTNTSFLPTDLTDNVTGISFSSDLDNGYYSNTQSGSISTIKALVNNGANWTRNDNLQTPPTWSFTINATSTTVTANTTVHNLSLASGETFVIGANTLTINGAVSGSGTLTGGSTSNLTIGGTAGTLSFTNGSRTLNNLIIGTGNTASITLGSALDITSTGGITFNAAGTKSFTTTGQTLTLKSDVTGTANLGNLNSTTITGNVTVERYIPSSTRRYRFLSSPVATDVADWRGEIFITGGGVSSDFSSVGTNNVKSNGLDWTLSGAPSMYAYTENLNSGSLNSRWEAITNGSTTLTAGKGYRVFVRGDRSNAGVLDNSVTSQSAVTINATGAINTGTQTLPVTYNGSTSDDGWNLVGNPYPSNIDWNAVSGWTKTNVSGTIWIYNPTNNTYGNWDGVTTTNGVTRNVSSGQAFFVRTTGSPVLSCTESVKVANAGASIFKTIEENTLRIGLVKDSSNSDETVIRFMEGKKDEFNDQDDVRKFINSTVNVSSNFGLDKYASVNYLDPKNLTNKVVPISAWVDENGTYQLNFNGMSSFNSTPYVLLKDKFLNKIVDLRTSNIYQFAITNDTKTKDDNRFEVIFSDKSTGLNESNSITNTNLSVYPNPATDVLNISLLNGTTIEAVNIYNVSGKLVNNTKLSENQIDISQLNNGVYIIEVITANGSFKTKFVK